MNNLYLYVNKTDFQNCLKYGIKLSEYANKTICIDTLVKKCITAYLAPKDSEKYYDDNFACLKINTKNLKIYIQNQIFENPQLGIPYQMCDISKYTLGQFEKPIGLICTTILPENISIYNKILDAPLFEDNSSNLFYSKAINEIVEACNLSNKQIYQAIFQIAEKSGNYDMLDEPSINVLIDKKNNNAYTNATDS